MNCQNCGSPLPAKSDLCRYCGSINDRDLRQVQHFIEQLPCSERDCPHCEIKLHPTLIDLGCNQITVHRCHTCLGLFFNPKELESVVDKLVAEPERVDYRRIDTLLAEEGRMDAGNVKYIKCPLCAKHMNRKNFGSRSGVIVDWCHEHGVWLDGGELRLIFKWVQAGGKQHHAQREEEQAKYKAMEEFAKKNSEIRSLTLGKASTLKNDMDVVSAFVSFVIGKTH